MNSSHYCCIVSNQIMKVLHRTLFERHVLRFALTVFIATILILIIIVIGVRLYLDALRWNQDRVLNHVILGYTAFKRLLSLLTVIVL